MKLYLVAFIFFLNISLLASSQPVGMELSPEPPKQALPNSLPPQRGWLPPAPAHLPLKEGYFPGENGVQLFYRVVGSGKDTVVFLHGGPTGIESGALDIEVLAQKGYTFISFDQRGGGRSELVRDSSKLDIYNYVADVEALRQFFHIGKLSLIGCAWGAGVSVMYGNIYPESMKSLILISPINPTSDYRHQQIAAVDSILSKDQKNILQDLNRQWVAADPKDLPPIWVKQDSLVITAAYLVNPSHYHSRGSFAGYPPLALRNTDITLKYAPRSLGNPYDLRPYLQHIYVPALVMEGAQTKVALGASKEYVAAIKNAKLVLIPNAGHMVWLDEPLTVVDEIDKFYKSIGMNK